MNQSPAGNDKRLPIWPYNLVAILALLVGGPLLVNNLGDSFPTPDELQQLTGEVDTVTRASDLSNPAGGAATAPDSVHFTLKQRQGTFRFPSGLPGFSNVDRRLAFEVDVWVAKSAIDAAGPMLVYRLEQRLPGDATVEPIIVTYEQVAQVHNGSSGANIKIGAGLLVVAAVFFVIGRLVDIWNRNRAELMGN